MLSLWLGICALGVSPELHHLLHKDAQKAGHTCVVTHLQQHSCLATFAATGLPEPPTSWGMLETSGEVQFLPSTDYLVSQGRAPPSPFWFIAVVG